jgi:hypothetical protein
MASDRAESGCGRWRMRLACLRRRPPPARILYPGVDFLTLSYVNKGSFTRAARPVAIFYGRP